MSAPITERNTRNKGISDIFPQKNIAGKPGQLDLWNIFFAKGENSDKTCKVKMSQILLRSGCKMASEGISSSWSCN